MVHHTRLEWSRIDPHLFDWLSLRLLHWLTLILCPPFLFPSRTSSLSIHWLAIRPLTRKTISDLRLQETCCRPKCPLDNEDCSAQTRLQLIVQTLWLSPTYSACLLNVTTTVQRSCLRPFQLPGPKNRRIGTTRHEALNTHPSNHPTIPTFPQHINP